MFWGYSGFQKNIKLLLKGRIRSIFKVFPGYFYCMRGPSLVELIGDDNSATVVAVTVQILMPPKEYDV